MPDLSVTRLAPQKMLVPDTARLACQGTEPTGATAPPTILERVVIVLLGGRDQ